MSAKPTRLGQRFGDHDAARMALKPFMPLEHYVAHFDFLLYANWYEQSYSNKSLEMHFELFQIFKNEFGIGKLRPECFEFFKIQNFIHHNIYIYMEC